MGLIEEAMPAANESVAHMLSQHDLCESPRVHEQPSIKLWWLTHCVAMGALSQMLHLVRHWRSPDGIVSAGVSPRHTLFAW